MDKTLKKSYKEVAQILDVLGEEYKNQIPDKLKQLFYYEKFNNDDVLVLNDYNKFENIKFTRETLIIISVLNFKYWEKDEKKKKILKNIYEDNEKKYQEKINAYKEKDWLSIKKNNYKDNFNEDAMEINIVVQNNNIWFERIKQFLKKIFHRKREC